MSTIAQHIIGELQMDSDRIEVAITPGVVANMIRLIKAARKPDQCLEIHFQATIARIEFGVARRSGRWTDILRPR
jgi:hypothetical protein